jgi:hypothetical protein
MDERTGPEAAPLQDRAGLCTAPGLILRKVTAMYATARCAGASHSRAMDAALAAYLQARSEARGDLAGAAARVAEMIAAEPFVLPQRPAGKVA